MQTTVSSIFRMTGRQLRSEMMKQNLLSDREIDVIADRVIQRLHITADISEVIAAIDDLNDKIKNLGNN